MSTIPQERSEITFEDFKEPLTKDQAVVEANRCLFCTDAPCINACPTHIDIPQFIRKISTGNIKGSAKTIFEANILGMSCARVCPVEVLCVGKCVYNDMGQAPIQIGKLQRYATDQAFEQEWSYFTAGADTGKKIALLGAGPASLACAHELRRYGHACTIYEKRDLLGGLNTTGVAPYKMKADRSDAEVKWILGIGEIEVKTGISIGEHLTFEELEAKYDAIFLGMGLGPDATLGIPGEEQGGIYGAVAFIEKMKRGKVSLDGIHRAVVIGGGNTAIDATRELVGLGIKNVTMMYRGPEEKMSGYQHEWEAAKIEGVSALWKTVPLSFEGQGHVCAVQVVSLDDNKKSIEGSEWSLPTDMVLLAIGQSKLGALVQNLEGIQIEKGCIQVDEHGFTGRAKYFAGGDCANGGKEVVNAAAEGKAAARAIHQSLLKM